MAILLITYRNTLWTRSDVRGRDKTCIECERKIASGEEAFRPLAENGYGVVRNHRICDECVFTLASDPRFVPKPTKQHMLIRHEDLSDREVKKSFDEYKEQGLLREERNDESIVIRCKFQDCCETWKLPKRATRRATTGVRKTAVLHLGEHLPKFTPPKRKKLEVPVRPGQLVSGDEAKPCAQQITKPCADCPFARTALPGWLGSLSVDQWLKDVHGETQINCHTLVGPQCAGAAVYRANLAKSPRDKSLLVLPADREAVFAMPSEFREHHTEGVPVLPAGKPLLPFKVFPLCALCGKETTEEHLCSGCKEFVCEECDEESPWGPHDLDEHSPDPLDLDL